ncbi:pyocin activator PrtN family protein [Falsirhodobacter sp. 20TX0035]|uniref:pyocin activator PrtN family protein n=1 Tax=Falsirhodobacter sp. 20TX0035 TaxID=3022019 RepID=UPI00232DEC6B|nr:pyocin activator PrtN family protein [Falsirhodobacter sp. 20TX0035]MDB6454466.1 pyocin activator PrtN family protein [Falsirhodobacter sp. 20TX0035]
MTAEPRISTIWLLMAQYAGRPIIPIEQVAGDHFRMTVPKLLEKISRGEIVLPVVRMSDSQKAAKGVHLSDMADYIDLQAEKARKEARQLSR